LPPEDLANLQMLGIATHPKEPNYDFTEVQLDRQTEVAMNSAVFKTLFGSVNLRLTFKAVSKAASLPFKFQLRYRLHNFEECISPTLVLDPTTQQGEEFTQIYLLDHAMKPFSVLHSGPLEDLIDNLQV
jgi:hypothetical protein